MRPDPRLPALLLLLLSFPVAAGAQEPVTWPAGLEAAALARLGALREGQAAVAASTIEAPLGIEQTQQFDRASHLCHVGPAQVVREYGVPRPRAAAGEGIVPVRYPYRLRYRKAASLRELFGKGWSEGTGGELEITFRRIEGAWEPGQGREVVPPIDRRR